MAPRPANEPDMLSQRGRKIAKTFLFPELSSSRFLRIKNMPVLLYLGDMMQK